MNARFLALMAIGAWLATRTVVAVAEEECQCADSNWTGECTGTIRKDGRFIFATSSSKQCSRIEWLAGEDTFVTLVGGGDYIHEWLGADGAQPDIVVQSCWACGKGHGAKASRASSSEESAEEADDPAKKKSRRHSDFAGRWIGEAYDAFGAPVTLTLILETEGKKLSGTWSTDIRERGPKSAVKGNILSDRRAKVAISGQSGGMMMLNLVDRRTIEYDLGVMNGTLTRE